MKTADLVRTYGLTALVIVALVSTSFYPAWSQQGPELNQQQPQAQPSQVNQPASPSSGETAGGPAAEQQLPDSPSASPPREAPMQSGTQQSQPAIHEPVGTAAAETVPTMGIAAARPAGVAMAPAKQHRVRIFLIKMGALVGAGVAIGTAVALSQASPSKPPGAR